MRSKQRNWRGVGNVLLCLVFAAGLAQAATESYMSIEGSRQGKFKGDSARQIGERNWIPLQEVVFVSGNPKAHVGERSSGRQMPHQVRIVKHGGASSHQIWQAMENGEILREVVIEFVDRDSTGAEQVEETITLRDVTVSSATHKPNHVDEITLTYQAMTTGAKTR